MNKDIKTIWTIGGILLVCFCIFVSISGCIDNSSTTPINNSSTTYQKNIIVCPNPECPLHDPNNTDDGNYGTRGRHIDMEVGDTTAGGTKTVYYLCQECGESWTG